MSTDMSQFYQVFFEEAAELLAEKENLLLGIDIDAPDPEQLNAIFRAAHSIKGGASTFGFADMTEVTHILESLLDRVRKGEARLTGVMVDAFLNAADVLKAQLAGHRGEGAPDPAAAAAVCATLKSLAGQGSAPIATAVPGAAVEAAPVQGGQTFAIEFDLPAGGKNPAVLDNLLKDLQGRGRMEIVQRPDASVGGHYVLRLATAISEEDIWEALAFVVDPAGLKIGIDAGVPPAQEAPAADATGYGFFEPLYQALVNPAAPGAGESRPEGRRESDEPGVDGLRTGRRASDKVAVSSNTDATSIRVNIEKVDQLINLVGELVITQAMLAQTTSRLDQEANETLAKSMGQLQRNTRDLQEAVMAIRMMPVSFVFSRFPRVVRDLATKLGKEVELKTVGEGTELDKGLIEKIADPLNHLVRNSLDHGIESPAVREAAGKPAKGTVTLRAFHQGGSVVIEVSDDGAGLNRERILAKAMERGLAVHDGMSDGEVWQLIFEAGFSTAEVVTDVSGRGVGMDVVKRNIHALSGSIDIQSVRGQGTQMSIRLPLTLAILDGLSVAVGDQTFIVPLTCIVECFQPRSAEIKSVAGTAKLVQVRGDFLPVVELHRYFHIPRRGPEMEKGIMIIMESDGERKAVFVDELLGQHQVVIKSLESNYRRVQGVSGATIMGDGRVALILDVAAIVRESATPARATA
ncbi:MAG TPA: chemotaxis protein CheW [Burkholderiales bacterium]|nr:chemotaxis protein CheW [Burkholderiales bacterium]